MVKWGKSSAWADSSLGLEVVPLWTRTDTFITRHEGLSIAPGHSKTGLINRYNGVIL